MANFQIITITIASIILILMLTFIGISLYNTKYHSAYPPVTADCPDYWLDESDATKRICKNKKNLGTCNNDEKDFSGTFWKGDDGLCRKKKWAQGCNLTWDGVTNNPKACSKK